MKAILFPGQGSQYVGMGYDLYKKFDLAKNCFESVDKTLGFSLSEIIFHGPESKLRLTQNTQPAIMTVGVCIYNVLKKIFNVDLNDSKFFAGHSLGEYTALVCSNSLTLDRAAYLLHERGKAMQESVPIGEGAMMAILGMTIDEVEKEINFLPKTDVCEIANDNSVSQVVVSGTKKAIELLNINIKKKRKKAIMLPVSAPFHCSLMQKASEIMKNKIEESNFLKPKPKIVSNVTAKEEDDISQIKPLLINQITSRVRWRESIDFMIQKEVKNFIEIGPGKVLSGLIKKINKDLGIKNISSLVDIENYVKNV